MSRPTRTRIAAGALLLAVGLPGVGALYEATGAAMDRHRAPAPGRMVHVTGHSMHLYCTGEGSPTVILEAGATGFAQSWAWIQPELARTTRVCSYDRAGMGWSEESPAAHDGQTTARRLRTLLMNAGEQGPYVLVGHSLGGALVRIFTGLYPDDVVALALIDPVHEDQLSRFPHEAREQQESFYSMLELAARLSPFGILRATNLIGRSAEGLPERDYRTARMFASSARHLANSHAELMVWDQTMEAVRRSRSLGSLPLVVVSATEAPAGTPGGVLQENHRMHAELARLSTGGVHYRLGGTDHFSLLMNAAHSRRVAELLQSLLRTGSRRSAEAVPPLAAPRSPGA